jgi:hypothetical protein
MSQLELVNELSRADSVARYLNELSRASSLSTPSLPRACGLFAGHDLPLGVISRHHFELVRLLMKHWL